MIRMHRFTATLRAIACLFALALPALASAQGTPGGAAPPASAEPYRVGAGDAIRVDVAGRTDISGTYTVGEDGTLAIPVVGSVRVLGRTAAEIRSDLARRISLFDRSSPAVSVSVAEYKSRKIFVLGAVLLPGIYAFAELPTIWDAIAEAGGPMDDANLNAVELIPGDATDGRKTTVIDVAGAIRESRTETLPRLRPGDTVRVPRGQNASTVLLMGAIARPGPLPFDQAPDLVTAVTRSGGATLDANQDEVQVIRQSGARVVRMRVNLDEYFKKGDLAGNPRLEPGDTVFIPRKEQRGLANFVSSIAPVMALVSSVATILLLLDR